MNETWDIFGSLLEERLLDGVFTTEDAVRYTFFMALLDAKYCKHTDISLEIPHPTIPKAEVDLFIRAGDGRPATAVEFKFDRPIPSEKNAPRTQKAGAVFKDIFRLARVPGVNAQQRFFVYLAASEMTDYFCNPRNRLLSFFELPEGQTYPLTLAFVNEQAATFRLVAGEWAVPCTVIGAYRHDLSGRFALRIYRVQN
ncbi:MAG TPA: hypothetical protein PKM21_07465 [Anaerolineales bacterium]|nr:hypothetical protein [Anaerolineales bacterium]